MSYQLLDADLAWGETPIATTRKLRAAAAGDVVRWSLPDGTESFRPVAAGPTRGTGLTTISGLEGLSTFTPAEEEVRAQFEALLGRKAATDAKAMLRLGFLIDGWNRTGTHALARVPQTRGSDNPRKLVLIHGVLSSASVFDTLGENGGISLLDQPGKGFDVWSFDHRTLGFDPIDNAIHFFQAVAAEHEAKGGKGWDETTLVVHSRGGIVAELIARACEDKLDSSTNTEFDARLATLRDAAKHVRLARIVRVGSPMRGSALATSKVRRVLERLLAALKLGLRVTVNPGPVASGLIKRIEAFLIGMAKAGFGEDAPSMLPGLVCMDPESAILQYLATANAPLEVETIALGSSWTPKTFGGRFATALPRWALDSFHEAPNDLAVRLDAMHLDQRAPGKFHTRVRRDRGVHHLNYFTFVSGGVGVDEVVAAALASSAHEIDATMNTYGLRAKRLGEKSSRDIAAGPGTVAFAHTVTLRLNPGFYVCGNGYPDPARWDSNTPSDPTGPLHSPGSEWVKELEARLNTVGIGVRPGEVLADGDVVFELHVDGRTPPLSFRLKQNDAAAAPTWWKHGSGVAPNPQPDGNVEALWPWATAIRAWVEGREPKRLFDERFPDSNEETLHDDFATPETVFYWTMFRCTPPRAAGPERCAIRISHGSPHGFEGDVLLVPQYQAEPLGSVLGRLADRTNDERVRRLQSIGELPRAGEVLELTMGRVPVCLLGLESPDRTDAGALSAAVERAMSRRLALGVGDRLRVGFVSLGQHDYESLSGEEALGSCIAGIEAAFERLEEMPAYSLEIFERYEDLAIGLAHAARGLAAEWRDVEAPIRQTNGFFAARPNQPEVRGRWARIGVSPQEGSLKLHVKNGSATSSTEMSIPRPRDTRRPLLGQAAATLREYDQLVLELSRDVADIAWELADVGAKSEVAPLGLRRSVVRTLADVRTYDSAQVVLNRRALVIGDPPGTGAPLPGANAEGFDVADTLRRAGYEVDHWHAPDGSSVLDALLREPFAIVHLATHGTTESGGKVLVGGGIELDLHDVLGVRHTPAMVVLSACDAGRMVGDGGSSLASSLAEAWLRRGVRIFVGAGWPVDDSLARELMVELYTRLAAGVPLGRALLGARQVAFRPNDATETWAAFQAYGDPEARLRRGQPNSVDLAVRFVHPSEIQAAAITLLGETQLAPPTERDFLYRRAEELAHAVRADHSSGAAVAGERVGTLLFQLGRIEEGLKLFDDARVLSHRAVRADTLARYWYWQGRLAWSRTDAPSLSRAIERLRALELAAAPQAALYLARLQLLDAPTMELPVRLEPDVREFHSDSEERSNVGRTTARPGSLGAVLPRVLAGGADAWAALVPRSDVLAAMLILDVLWVESQRKVQRAELLMMTRRTIAEKFLLAEQEPAFGRR